MEWGFLSPQFLGIWSTEWSHEQLLEQVLWPLEMAEKQIIYKFSKNNNNKIIIITIITTVIIIIIIITVIIIIKLEAAWPE